MCNTFEEEIEENRNYWFDQWSKADRENKALQDKLTEANTDFVNRTNQWLEESRKRLVLMDEIDRLASELKTAEKRAKLAEEGWKDPVILHTHILRTLNHSQIMHIVGDDVAAEVTRLTTEVEEWRAEAEARGVTIGVLTAELEKYKRETREPGEQ